LESGKEYLINKINQIETQMKRNRLKTVMTMLRYYYFISSIINKDNYYFLFMELFYNDDYKLEAIAQKFFYRTEGCMRLELDLRMLILIFLHF